MVKHCQARTQEGSKHFEIIRKQEKTMELRNSRKRTRRVKETEAGFREVDWKVRWYRLNFLIEFSVSLPKPDYLSFEDSDGEGRHSYVL